jgi:hypothetical protein
MLFAPIENFTGRISQLHIVHKRFKMPWLQRDGKNARFSHEINKFKKCGSDCGFSLVDLGARSNRTAKAKAGVLQHLCSCASSSRSPKLQKPT